MSLENKIISTLIASREAFNKLEQHINKNTFSDYGQDIYNQITKFYQVDNSCLKVDKEIISRALQDKLGEKKYKLYHEYLEALPEPASLPNLLNLFVGHRQERLGLEISAALAGKHDKKVKELMQEYLTIEAVQEDEEEVLNGTPLDELEKQLTGKNLIPVYPTKLNELLGGGIPRRCQVCIIARPDVGKSTQAINMAGGAALQDYKVAYFTNEDPAATLMYRIVSRILKRPISDIKQDLQGSYEEAMQLGYGNIHLIPLHPGTLKDIRTWVERLRPDLVVIDQLRNLDTGADGMTANLERAAIDTRNLAKEFNYLSVIVTQAGDSAHGQLYLNYNNVDSSRTGIAGAIDFMIAMGQNDTFKEQGKVMLSFPKCKYWAPIKPMAAKIDYTTQRLLT